MMKISQAGIDFIKGFESYLTPLPDGSCTAYKCPAGVWTIGWGCTEGVKPGMVWTKEQAEFALRRELAKAEAAVNRLVTVPISQPQFDALVSFTYNCGFGALAKSSLLKRLNAGDVDGAAGAFAMWNKGGGKVLRGLVRRRKDEAAMFLSAAEPELEPPPMAQAVTVDVSAAPLPKSGTIWGTAAGAIAGVIAYLEQTMAGLLEWAAKLTELSPVQSAFASMGGNIKSLSLGLGIGAAVYVVSRRVKAAQEGKIG
jgi:lysozyme